MSQERLESNRTNDVLQIARTGGVATLGPSSQRRQEIATQDELRAYIVKDIQRIKSTASAEASILRVFCAAKRSRDRARA